MMNNLVRLPGPVPTRSGLNVPLANFLIEITFEAPNRLGIN